MPTEASRLPRLAALYPSDEPALSRFFLACSAIEPVRGISFERANEFLQIALGLYPHDPMKPYRMLVPSGPRRWRPWWHGPLFRRLTHGAKVVFFTRPDQAALLPYVADKRLAYYAIDDYRHYTNFRLEDERAVVAAAVAVFVCSPAVRERFVRDYGIPAERVTVLHMGIPARHIPPSCPLGPAPVPGNAATGRPLFGLLGTIGDRLRYDWVQHCVDVLPWSHWLWVGPIESGGMTEADWDGLKRLKRHPRCRFLGRKDYDELPAYAAALDAAVIPYNDRSIVPAASPMRYFLQLPYGSPILATPSCETLKAFSPDVRICGSAEELAAALTELRAVNFDDGRREHRWRRARAETWEERAERALRQLAPHLEA